MTRYHIYDMNHAEKYLFARFPSYYDGILHKRLRNVHGVLKDRDVNYGMIRENDKRYKRERDGGEQTKQEKETS